MGCASDLSDGALKFDSIHLSDEFDPICKRLGKPEPERVYGHCSERTQRWNEDPADEYHFLTIATDDIEKDPSGWAAPGSSGEGPAVVTTVPTSVVADGAGLWDASAVDANDACLEESIEAVGRDGVSLPGAGRDTRGLLTRYRGVSGTNLQEAVPLAATPNAAASAWRRSVHPAGGFFVDAGALYHHGRVQRAEAAFHTCVQPFTHWLNDDPSDSSGPWGNNNDTEDGTTHTEEWNAEVSWAHSAQKVSHSGIECPDFVLAKDEQGKHYQRVQKSTRFFPEIN